MNERLLKFFRETCDSHTEALLKRVVDFKELVYAKEQKAQQKVEARKAKYNTKVGRREKSKRDRRLPQELYNPDAPQRATSRYPRKMERKSDVAVGREIKRRAVGGRYI